MLLTDDEKQMRLVDTSNVCGANGAVVVEDG